MTDPNAAVKDPNEKAKREMHEAVDKMIEEKKQEPIGTEEARKKSPPN